MVEGQTVEVCSPVEWLRHSCHAEGLFGILNAHLG